MVCSAVLMIDGAKPRRDRSVRRRAADYTRLDQNSRVSCHRCMACCWVLSRCVGWLLASVLPCLLAWLALHRGVKKQFSYKRRTVCRGCKGRGAKNVQRCPKCGGSGVGALPSSSWLHAAVSVQLPPPTAVGCCCSMLCGDMSCFCAPAPSSLSFPQW